jgi:hypothetical protein
MATWPMTAMMVDVLPAPFGPNNAKIEPVGTSKLTLCTASTEP